MRLKQVRQVLLYTLALNLAVAVAKIGYGHLTGSISMLSDGFHSFFDGSSNIVGLVGIWIASRPPDRSHPYGHRKFETLSTVAIAVLIFFAGAEILREAWSRMKESAEIEVNALSFLIMVITLAVNLLVSRYETRKGHELNSRFLLADAMHTKSDVFVSLSVIISLIAAKTGYPVVDVVAAVIITVFIAQMGFSILKSATGVLTDAAYFAPEDIKELAARIPGVKDCHGIRTRGDEIHVNIDLHVLVDPEIKTKHAHEVAHEVEEAIKEKFPSIKDVVIHIEPFQEERK